MDVTQKTVTAGSMLNGTTALKNDGTDITGSIASKTSSDLTASGATVTAPAGYYASAASKAVSSGSATAPATISGSSATVSTGTNTLTLSKTVSVTPSVTAGYVSSGTAGNSAVSLTASVNTRSSSDLTASTLTVTAPAGYYGSDATKTLTDANLSAGNIKKDVTIFGTTGTYEGGGGGGGTTPAPKKQINFIDYDGTILYSYTSTEINAMTSESDLPANPSHTGLTAQGWNWTLAQIKAQLTSVPNGDVWVGQMYVTTSGKTEIDVTFADAARLNPILTIAVNGTVSVDWGDNTTADTVTGTSLTTRLEVPHTYASTGDYTIKISVTNGNFTFYGSNSYTLLRKNTTSNENRVYSNNIKRIRLGSGITSIGNSAFYYCYSLASITIPSNVTSINGNAFYNCYSLSSITIPSNVTSIGDSAFSGCYSLASITIPSNVTSIGSSAFSNCYSIVSITIPSNVSSISGSAFSGCYSIDSITIPSNVTSIGNSAFSGCYSLSSITIPSNVTSIGNSAFSNCYSLASITILSNVTSIGNSAFSYCYSLASITIPSNVTSIGNTAFTGCYGMKEYHIKPTTIPTGGTTMFNGIVSDCIIYVPTAKLSDYKSASQWSTYASYMQGE